MPTATNFALSFNWETVTGVFNALVELVSSPVALTIGLILVLSVGAFVVGSLTPPARRERQHRPKKAKTLADTRTPPGLADVVDIPPPPSASAAVAARPVSDDPVEQSILDHLVTGGGPAHIDDITQDLDLPAYQVSAAITMLELKGIVENDGLHLSLAGPQAAAIAANDDGDQLVTSKTAMAIIAQNSDAPATTQNVTELSEDPDRPARGPKRNYPRLILALVAWLGGIISLVLGDNKHPSRPDPNLVRPDYVPEIEPPPAKEYVPPLELDPPMESAFQSLVDELEQESEQVNLRLAQEKPETRRGQIVRVFGSDPSRQYDLQYDICELSGLITSNDDAGQINPAYPAELQPRDRTRAASSLQIDRIARSLEPEALLSEFRALDRGAPIIGDDNAVESGNGRVLALRRAAADYQENYQQYRQRLAEIAPQYGLDPARLDDYHQPVLVRRRVSEVDRVAFTQEANSAAILGMSETEQARNDARRISAEAIGWLEVGDDVDRALRSARNRDFIRSFVAQLPENERASIIDREGDLTQSGLRRVKAALFNRVYDSPKLSDRLFESTDNDIKNITNGLMASLGRLAQAEELVRQGRRNPDLSLAGDIAVATEKLSSLKDQGLDVSTYLAQGQMFGRELSPAQERILEALDERRRSGKKVGELVGAWADLVMAQPDPNQISFFGQPAPAKDELVDRWLKEPQGQMAMSF